MLRVEEASANIVSITVVLSVILAVSTPAFFGISNSKKLPTTADLCLMFFMGLLSTYGLFAGLATLQVIKNKVRFLLHITVAVTLTLYAYQTLTIGFGLQKTIGVILGLVAAISVSKSSRSS